MKIFQINKSLNLKKTNETFFSSHKVSFQSNNDKFERNIFVPKTGVEIPEFGIITGITKLQNSKTKNFQDCFITYKKTENGAVFYLIKNDKEKIEKFIKTKQIENKKDLIISEIGYTYLRKENELKRLEELNYQKEAPDKDVVCIQNLIVYQNEYPRASKQVYIPLLKSLEKHKETNIIIKANAFGENPQSPINLYLHSGFVPLNSTKEEIESHKIQTPKGLRIDPKYSVVMYLPKDAILHKLIQKVPLDNFLIP